MKIFLTFGFLITFSFNVFSQNPMLYKYWKKTEITLRDSSKIYSPEVVNQVFDLNILSADSLIIYRAGKAAKMKYKLLENTLFIDNLVLKIKLLDEGNLVLYDYVEPESSKAIQIKFIPKKLYDLTFTPEYYTSKSKETVYLNVQGKLEPSFMDKEKSAVDFIFDKFGFPEFKKGGFVVRFIINKNAEVKGVKVLATSNERYNDKLVAAVYKTKGKWQAAQYQGENVNVEMEYDFNLGYNDRQVSSKVDSVEYSKMYFNYGTEVFSNGSYKQAEQYYRKSISYDPLNVNAYYQHAAACIALRKLEDACRDYEQLIFMDQRKAKILKDKYCK